MCPTQASPGNLQQLEDVLFGSLDMASSLTIMAVKLTTENGQRVLGIAYAELSSERLGVAEFIENDQFSNLEVCAYNNDVCIDITILVTRQWLCSCVLRNA